MSLLCCKCQHCCCMHMHFSGPCKIPFQCITNLTVHWKLQQWHETRCFVVSLELARQGLMRSLAHSAQVNVQSDRLGFS